MSLNKIRIYKETAVPAIANVVASTMYAVTGANADYLELYMSNSAGDALRRIPTTADTQALIDASTSGQSAVEIVDDIAALTALEATLTVNTMVIVEDASADADVDSGAALYAFKASDSSRRRLAEFESMDVVLNWVNIVNGPSSTATQIDATVAAMHSHTNKTQLDLIGQDAEGDLTYAGVVVANELGNEAW